MPAFEDIAPPLEHWKSYEYFEGGHKYRDVEYDPGGGPDGLPCIWADDALWTIDTPEHPHSILFLLHYRFWDYEAPVDLREMTLRCRLRGEKLELHGAKAYFWVVTYGPAATRWHYVAEPIPISLGDWGEATILNLRNDPALWHRSFAAVPDKANNLDHTLSVCFSYGLSFVGFSEKVTGRIALSDFCLAGLIDPCWPFVTNSRNPSASAWLTVSRRQERQVPITGSVPGKGVVFQLRDDYWVVPYAIPFSYLAFVRGTATGFRDLRHAVLMICQQEENLDLQGGKIAFFVEHAASDTRWVLLRPLDNFGLLVWYCTLDTDERLWLRLSGDRSLGEVLSGGEGCGYDYLGMMVVGCQRTPSGTWGLTQFSLGPALPPP